MKRLLFFCVVFLVFSSGCTIHFKGEKIELDAERQRVENNATYELADIDIL